MLTKWTDEAIAREIAEASAHAARMMQNRAPAREPMRRFVARSAPRPQRSAENPAANVLRSIAAWRALGLVEPGSFSSETVDCSRLDRPAAHSLLAIAAEGGRNVRGALGWRGAQLYDALAPAPRDCEREYSTTIRNAVATLVLHDNIGEAFDGVSADRILSDIGRVAAERVERVDLDIFSIGGDARSSLEIHDALCGLGCHITAHVNGIAASGASIVASAASEIAMHRDSFFMLHNTALSGVARDDDEQEHADGETVELDEAMLAIYVARTGLDENVVAEMMAVEFWLCAHDALELGLCDEVIE